MKNRIIIGLYFCLANIGAHADINKCQNLVKQTEINQCANKELNRVNNRINLIYSEYMKSLEPSEQLKLKESQRLWIKFKEKDCAFEASSTLNGSMHPYVLSACLIDRTEQRIKQIENMKNCTAGTEPGCL